MQPTVNLTEFKRITNLADLLSCKARTITGDKQHWITDSGAVLTECGEWAFKLQKFINKRGFKT